MEIIVSDLIEKLSGRLWSGCGYVVKTRELPNGKHKHFSSRIVPPQLACYDPLHWKFIRAIATLAVEHDEAFDALLYGFMKHKYKTIELSGAMKLVTLRRGWMTEKLADEFTDYCITGWKIV